MLYEDRVALFDGRRFVRELIVPGAYRRDEPIRSFVEVGSEAWLGSPAGVARYVSGLWSMVGEDRLRSAASLTIGPHGHVWASGRLGIRNGRPRGVVRFDGQTWQPIGGPVPMVPQEEIIANVAGDLVYVIGNGVYRSAGTEWRTLAWDNTDWGAIRSLAVTEDGHVWLQRQGGVARWEASSGWEAVGTESAGWDDQTIQALAADGNDVFVAGGEGLLRVDGNELTPVWAPARVGPRTDRIPPEDHNWDALREPSLGLLRVVSSDELWLASGSSLLRYQHGHWESEWRLGPDWDFIPGALPTEGRSAKLTVATDGSVWISTQEGMVRFAEGQSRVVDGGPAYGWTSVGPDGAVWVAEPGIAVRGATIREPGDDITLVGPEGRRGSVPLPVGANAMTSVHSSADGCLFVTMRPYNDHDEPSPHRELLRWDGRWTPVPYPGEDLVYLAADARGGLWAAVIPVGAPKADPVVARYAQGEWALFPEASGLSSLTPAPGGSVCGMDQEGRTLVCVDTAGRVFRQPLGVSGGLSIGEDGSVWLTYQGVLARLPMRAPG